MLFLCTIHLGRNALLVILILWGWWGWLSAVMMNVLSTLVDTVLEISVLFMMETCEHLTSSRPFDFQNIRDCARAWTPHPYDNMVGTFTKLFAYWDSVCRLWTIWIDNPMNVIAILNEWVVGDSYTVWSLALKVSRRQAWPTVSGCKALYFRQKWVDTWKRNLDSVFYFLFIFTIDFVNTE